MGLSLRQANPLSREATMPLYFAYGTNMNRAAMARRCPRSKPLGVARLARHRLGLMAEGFATVAADPSQMVYGLLWDLALADTRPLDAYEDVSSGLYVKKVQPVLKQSGGSARALVYFGRGRGQGDAQPQPGHIEEIIAAARELGLPASYVRTLQGFMPAAPLARPVPGQVRPRFATPFDRS
jgi:hypothetical protein